MKTETLKDLKHRKNIEYLEALQELTLEHCEEDATDFINTNIQADLIEYSPQEIFDELNDTGFFNVEIIYYYKAMEYLKENDCSLSESIELANEMGFALENINSETLASLHASKQREETFFNKIEPQLNKIYYEDKNQLNNL
tara:strand:+ start:377 stop:802 length:426 start_codon:yes stop_codon:yes gene_type:complete